MRKAKKSKLEAMGWKFGDAQEFLDLTPEEAAYIELKLALTNTLKDLRKKNRYTQQKVAKLLRSSQSRVAKMEAGDPSVSLDLLVKSLFLLGASKKDVAKSISKVA